MIILKRNGKEETYCSAKIKRAMSLAFSSVNENITEEELDALLEKVEGKIGKADTVSVEDVQDFVEKTLMEANHYEALKSYILYREEHSRKRKAREKILSVFEADNGFIDVLTGIQEDFVSEEYDLRILYNKYLSFQKQDMSEKEKLSMLIRAAVELTTQEAPRWEQIAARFLMLQFDREHKKNMESFGVHNFYEKLEYLTEKGLYGEYILQNYSQREIEELSQLMDVSRNKLFHYAGLSLLLSRYVIRNRKGVSIETPQEMFLGIALHLAMKEKENRNEWVKRFYDMLSLHQVTMATPTLANARKPYHQLSSCFIDTVPDSLDGIYRSIDNFAKVSKFGGGMGLYFGKVRANGSMIRGFEGAAGGVIRWIRLANDTAVAVDQLGVRQGAVAVYLDAWHWDLPEFLALRTNNGDDRMKAHDVFPGVCYPDYFWEMARDHIDEDWYLMCPHEIKSIKGYSLEDYFGKEWEEKYLDCVKDMRIKKRAIPVKEIVRLVIKSVVETGTPFTFNRDLVNEANPNSHKGIIYCSNLCTEIAQNMKEIQSLSQEVKIIGGEEVVVTTTKPGEFVVCNLASLALGNLDVENEEEMCRITESAVRALDNVIDLNFFPVPYAKINNEAYRPIGLGVSGYHHMLAKRKISWESEEHLAFVDKVFANIHYGAVLASSKIAEEKGSYRHFEGSQWQTGEYFEKRGLTDERFTKLKERVQKHGLRNGYLIAIAPTSSTSMLIGTTAGLDPIMDRYFLEEKKTGLVPRVAPELSQDTFWYYKNAHYIDQKWSVRAGGVRQRHIDQAQSMNLYITNEYSFRQVLDLYILAWEKGIKTIYYIRSKSLEVEECEVCSS